MSDLFLCGALGDRRLASVVLDLAPEGFSDAVLPDHRVVVEAACPMGAVEAQEGASVAGLLATGVSEQTRARLAYFLAVFGARLWSVEAAGLAVWVSVRSEEGARASGGWPDAVGSTRFSDYMCRVAGEIMGYHDVYTPAEMAKRLPVIRSRAQLWVNQRAEPADPAHDLDRDVVVRQVHRPYLNFFTVQELDLQYRRQDGTMSEVINRGALQIGEASAVLPYDPVADTVLLIEQFRASVYMGGSRSPWIWEAVAGMVDVGETPEETAHREAMEEAGLTLRHLEPLASGYSSPGCMCDRLFLYVGLTDMSQMVEAGGLVSEGEDIRREVMSFDAFMEGIDSQKFRALPLIAMGLWLARHRDRLRAIG